MMYAPHILFKKIKGEVIRDEFGRPSGSSEDRWTEISRCRCDDNTTQKFDTPYGEVYIPKYHIVCEGKLDVAPGDEVRCEENGSIRAEGKVFITKRHNYYYVTEIWV